MVVKTNPYSTNNQSVIRNMNSTASTQISFVGVLDGENLFVFLPNLPMAARYASMDIMITVLRTK